MPLPKVIAFVGPIGAGKTTTAKLFIKLWPHYRLLSFATPLKDMLMAAGLSSEEVYGGDKEKKSILLGGKTPRYAMQTLGTEWGRNLISPDLWVNLWLREASSRHPLTWLVIDDTRFPNEYAAVKSLGGIAIEVYRKTAMRGIQHESERHIFDCVASLNNNGNISDLEKNLKRLFLEIAN